jgi:hypothetical protein
MFTPCSPRNCSSSSSMPRTPSAFQQASRRCFRPAVLCRTVMVSNEQDKVFEIWHNMFSCWNGWGRREKTTCQLCAGRGMKFVEVCRTLDRRMILWTTRSCVSQPTCNGVVENHHYGTTGITLGQPAA